jgi:hypothetical protein
MFAARPSTLASLRAVGVSVRRMGGGGHGHGEGTSAAAAAWQPPPGVGPFKPPTTFAEPRDALWTFRTLGPVSNWIRSRPNNLKANQAYFQSPAIARLPVYLMGPYDNYTQWFLAAGLFTGALLAWQGA